MDMRGGIRGTVRNANKAGVPDTIVTAVSATNGAKFEATTDAQGNYSFGALPVGGYNITVVSAGLTAFRRQGVQVTADQNVTLDITLDAASAQQAADTERQVLLEELAELRQRVTDLESSAVLSEPETRVKRVEVFVDQNGNEHDEPVPGAKKAITYRRERVYRRQTINEKVEEAIAAAEEHNVKIGVDAAVMTQYAQRTKGNDEVAPINRHAYGLASADLFFTAGIAAVLLCGRLASASPVSGQLYELDAIAAVVIGGTSLMGGDGAIGGTLIGALIMGVLRNGLNLLGISSFLQQVVIGLVIIAAVLVDSALKAPAKT